MPAPHHSVFTGWTPFLLPNQQCQSTNILSINHWPDEYFISTSKTSTQDYSISTAKQSSGICTEKLWVMAPSLNNRKKVVSYCAITCRLPGTVTTGEIVTPSNAMLFVSTRVLTSNNILICSCTQQPQLTANSVWHRQNLQNLQKRTSGMSVCFSILSSITHNLTVSWRICNWSTESIADHGTFSSWKQRIPYTQPFLYSHLWKLMAVWPSSNSTEHIKVTAGTF